MTLTIVPRIVILALLLCRSAYAYGPYTANLVNTVDGDTFKADIEIWPGLTQRVLVRLAGVDAPELKGPTACEKALAINARAYLDTLLRSGKIAVTAVNHDKFAGRVDAVVTVTGVDASISLITSGHGRQYLGGPRLPWCV
jgi:endonuclease YncB( thermonuclease family)